MKPKYPYAGMVLFGLLFGAAFYGSTDSIIYGIAGAVVGVAVVLAYGNSPKTNEVD